MFDQKEYQGYLSILSEELVPATGCTEPIAMAFCAATVRKTLGAMPEKLEIEVSGNILKNVKSVVVPNTNNLRGPAAAAAVGIVAGQSEKELNVIGCVTEEQKAQVDAYLAKTPVAVTCSDTPCALDIKITGYAGGHMACVRIANNHTNIVYIRYDDEIIRDLPVSSSPEENLTDKSILNVTDIVAFANSVDMADVIPILKPQVEFNCSIGEEGLRNSWGAEIGKLMMKSAAKTDYKTRALAFAAAGSDARMSGCEMPVIIVSGSGNQGMTASLPIVSYCRDIGASEEQMYRALTVSNLVTIHQKTGIGRLSAYCGAVSAGVGAGAGIAYLLGGGVEGVAATISNAVAILSGTICDGAKPSCAAKIAMAVGAGITGYEMFANGKNFLPGDGIVGSQGVEETIKNVGVLAAKGMDKTDRIILNIMTGIER